MRKLKLAKRPYAKTRKYEVVEKKMAKTKEKPEATVKVENEMTQEEREDFWEHSEPVKEAPDTVDIKLIAVLNFCAYPFGYTLKYNPMENNLKFERLAHAPVSIKAYRDILTAVKYVNEQISKLKQ